MHIDGDDVLPEGALEDDGGGFGADAFDLQQLRFGVGDLAAAVVEQVMGNIQNRPRFLAIETDRIDRFLDRLRGECHHLYGSVGQCEQPFTCRLGHFVLGAKAERNGDRDRVGGAPVAVVALFGRGVPFWVLPPKNGDRFVELSSLHTLSVFRFPFTLPRSPQSRQRLYISWSTATL